jgi:ABC-2 type transport system ATP-binding protein
MSAISFENLSKTFVDRSQRKQALKGISFEVEEGEIFGFLGPNGAGKTTSMHILLDFIFPTSGGSRIRGIDSRDPRSRESVGFLPEIFSFDNFLTGVSFLKLFGKLSQRNRDHVAAAIPELLKFFEMPDAGNVKIRNYSKGMTQKIGLAQALIGDPKILVLDEPTSGMDPIGKARIKQLFKKLRSEGKTVFLSTHILSDVEDIADRVAIINDGTLLAVDKISALVSVPVQRSKIAFVCANQPAVEQIRARAEVVGTDSHYEATCPNKETKDFVLKVILENAGDIESVKALGSSLQDSFLKLVQKEELSSD